MIALRLAAAGLASLAALIFGLLGLVGLFRFRDPYDRLQAGSLCGTTAVFSAFGAALFLAPSWAAAARIGVITLLFMVSGPTGNHVVARFIWNSGITPHSRGKETRGKRL